MRHEVIRIAEQDGYRIYRRAQNRKKGWQTIPKYFIVKRDELIVLYFKEFSRLPSAKKELKSLCRLEITNSRNLTKLI